MDIADAIKGVEARLGDALSRRRVEHSRRVAEYTALLCTRNGIDPERGRLAGLAHDICKEAGIVKQRAYAEKYRAVAERPISRSIIVGDTIVHGPAAAGFLMEELGFVDEDVLEAVAFHTLGAPDLGALAQLLYAADKLEPGRKNIDNAFRLDCEALDPTELFYHVMGSNLAWMRARSMPIAAESLELYDRFSRGGLGR
ncbi:MAG: HD domain-containing protein [Spirochaetota bacterium]